MSKDSKYELLTFYQNFSWVYQVKCKSNQTEKVKQVAS